MEHVCSKCGQKFIEGTEAYKLKDDDVCKACYDKHYADLYRWDNKYLAIRGEQDGETFLIPFVDNALFGPFKTFNDDDDLRQAFEIIKAEMEGHEWGYGKWHPMENLELVDVRDTHPNIIIGDNEIVKCEETDLYLFDELAHREDLYWRPFDEAPTATPFLNDFAFNCFAGKIYSKDFGFGYCEGCGRWICVQNPSNGWMSQMHYHDTGECECNRCYEERVLKEGINDEFDNDLPGQFFNDDEIIEAGWERVHENVLAGMGRYGNADPNIAVGYVRKLIDEGYRVLVSYVDIAIGGLGGYVDIWKKA